MLSALLRPLLLIVGLGLLIACATPGTKAPPPTETIPGQTATSTPSTATTEPIPSLAGAGATYYVSPQGSDAAPGTRERPWASPGYASKQLRPGDTLVIQEGRYVLREYYTDMVTPEVSGTADAWIAIVGEPGRRPVLQGASDLLAAIDVGGKSYIRIENLEFSSLIDAPYTGGLREGIEAGGSGGGEVSHIAIADVEIHHVEEAGINLAGNASEVRLERLSIHHTGGPGISAPGTEGDKGWQNIVVANSSVRYAGYFYRGQEQPSEWDRPDGIGMEDSQGPLEIYGSIFEHNRGDGIDSKAKNTYVHHTIVANNRGDSLKFWGDGSRAENVLIYGDGDGDPENGPWASIVIDTEQPGRFEFINVTVDENTSRNGYPIYIQYENPVPVTVVLRNSIVAHGHDVIYMGDSVTLVASNNLLYRTGDPNQPTIYVNGRGYLPSEVAQLGPGNLSAEPRFVKRAWGTVGDYRLEQGSPAIDAGTDGGAPVTDLDGIPRPRSRGYDLGAYEG